MPRYRITLEYDGGGFVGWQRQVTGMSVQEALEDALINFTGAPVRVLGAGRTDSGVHALGQVAHFDLPTPRPLPTIRDAINFHVRPHPVGVLHAEEAKPEFEARFSAILRTYRYRILNRRSPAIVDAGKVWHLGNPLDEITMQEAADRLAGHHDFTSFRATTCQAKSPVRTLDVLKVSRHGDEVWVEAEARSFLHNQIRIITGTLARVGHGAWTPDDVSRALDAKDRAAAGPTAPPSGLYLTSVQYPEDG